MGVETAPSQGPIPRVSVGASMLIAVLLSLPLAAEARASALPTAAGRVALSPDQVLPIEIARRLCAGIRFADESAPASTETRTAAPARRPVHARPIAAAQLGAMCEAQRVLPPPSAGA